MKKVILGLIMGLPVYVSTYVQAASAGEAAAGRKIAQKFCASCHAIGATGESPHPSAPPFRVIVARANIANLEEALGEGAIVGHPDMPQFEFKQRDAGNLIAYLKSLSGRG